MLLRSMVQHIGGARPEPSLVSCNSDGSEPERQSSSDAGFCTTPHRPRVLSVADRRASARFSWSAVRFRSCAAVIHLLSSFQPFSEHTLRAGDGHAHAACQVDVLNALSISLGWHPVSEDRWNGKRSSADGSDEHLVDHGRIL